jgi:beta-glucosidase
VAQLYLSHRGIESAPLLELKGFKRLHLAPHASRTVDFELDSRDVSLVDTAGVRRIVPGDVDVWVGGGQGPAQARAGLAEPSGASTSFHLVNATVLPD